MFSPNTYGVAGSLVFINKIRKEEMEQLINKFRNFLLDIMYNKNITWKPVLRLFQWIDNRY
jgi:hypothetical protein